MLSPTLRREGSPSSRASYQKRRRPAPPSPGGNTLVTDYNPSVAERRDVQKQLERFCSKHLGNESRLRQFFVPKRTHGNREDTIADIKQSYLDGDGLEAALTNEQLAGLQVFSLAEVLTTDGRKLAISPSSFKLLVKKLDLPASFVSALCQNYQPCGTGFRSLSAKNPIASWDYWSLIPFRVRDECERKPSEEVHTSLAGRNQMNPYNYIHLKDVGEDIRGSHIALYVRRDSETNMLTVLIITFLDNRFHHLVKIPFARLSASIAVKGADLRIDDGLLMHLICLNMVVEWWNDVFYSFNDQLVVEEMNLQVELENPVLRSADLARSRAAVNKRLHVMAAHLHRYGTELGRVEDIILELETLNSRLNPVNKEGDAESASDEHHHASTANEIGQLLSQTRAIKYFRNELERKTENILNLLFNNMQVINDQTMTNILQATRLDNERSRGLALSMKEDSIAMKTIAILTMFFLPGTSYAALLSMPFFTNSQYLATQKRIWIWIVLTVPSTIFAFLIYWRVMTRGTAKYGLVDSEARAEEQNIANGDGETTVVHKS